MTNPALVRRALVAALIGLMAAALCFFNLSSHHILAGDFTWPLRGAQLLLAGHNPYHSSLQPLPYSPNDPLWYPLPALLIAVPFTGLPAEIAGAAFFGISCAILAFVLIPQGWWRLLLFVSGPFYFAATIAQWAPLLTAAAVCPALFLLVIAKPNMGAPITAAYPSWRRILLCAAVLACTLILLPSWPLDWLSAIRTAKHRSPLTTFAGPLILLALLRWRQPEARLLLGLALVPQLLYGYDALPLWLIPRTQRQTFLLTIASWIGMFTLPVIQTYSQTLTDGWLFAWYYLPALAIILLPYSKQLAERFRLRRQRHSTAS